MNDFVSAQAQLAQARKSRDAARAAAALASERSSALATERKKSSRGAVADEARVARWEELMAHAKADLDAKRRDARTAEGAAAASLERFAVYTDPRRNAERFQDSSPFVLFPVRLETRFMRIGAGDGVRTQLWVRIYPDDCSIDTFEATLSATEIANAQAYWHGIFRAGGIEADERAAWRSLVAAHGAGRAGYIVDSYQPTNLPPPPKAAATDEILVISTQTPLITAEATAISTYWRALWLADGDAALTLAAQAELETAVGASRAKELVSAYQAFNFADRPAPPKKKSDVVLSVAFVVFPPDPPSKQGSWTQAPQVRHFPERFVVLGFTDGVQTLEAIGGVVSVPFYVGPDPSADPKTDPTSAIHPDGGDLFVPDQLKWMVDFGAAVTAGLGLAIDLTREQAARGFDRLLVLGVQLSLDAAGGQAALEEILSHHAFGRAGLSLAPQGTTTHNTTGKGAGYTKFGDADQSFDDRKNAPLFVSTSDAMQKRDGQWLAESFGINPAMLTGIHAAGGKDQMRARAMQRVLWPATLGYWMDKLMAPVFSDDVIANTRWFVSNFVTGCGAAPAIRIGGQPYGVLPTTAFSRVAWLNPQRGVDWRDPQIAYVGRLFEILRKIDADWAAMAANNSHVGKDGDAHQILLDVVGLHASSVEYYSRSAESLSELFNLANLWGLGPAFFTALEQLGLHAAAAGLLKALGYNGDAQPDILQHYFLRDAGFIKEIIDDRPLSEADPLRAYADDNKRNYIQWLIDASGSLDELRTEHGFLNNVTPQALLYLYLRHALMLGYYDSSYNLHKSAGLLSAIELAAMKPEPPFIHVAASAGASESRFAYLYKTDSRITGSPSLQLCDYIALNLGALPAAEGLNDQIEALKILVDAPTAQLERAFAEHIDICSYRFDAWMLGVVNFQLQRMRAGDQKQSHTGAYLGAYSWLEDLRLKPSTLTPAQLSEDVAGNFKGSAPIMQDAENGGYIHAPSLTQARTAAVLRSGYLTNATPANPDTMAVNLSSDRVRLALSLLEGVRNGQSIGALLGYRFERGLHDAYGPIEVDKYIYPLRKAFPLVADGLTPTKTPPDVPIEAIEARNVLDGRKLIGKIMASNNAIYPFGVADLPRGSAAEEAAITAEANKLRDVYDAISDLALAEGVHQAVAGNFDRIGATLDAYTTGNFPPDPEVVQTRPTGIGLTHRVSVHFRSGLAVPAGATPRAACEPALDDWLAGVLPPLDSIGGMVKWTDADGGARNQAVTIADLGLLPIDVLALMKPDDIQAMSELDDRVLDFIIATAAPPPNAGLAISYLEAPAGKTSIFESFALTRQLRTLLANARPLQATDASLSNDARAGDNAASFVDRARITGPAATLDQISADITTFLGTLSPLLTDPAANRAVLIAGVDAYLDSAMSLLSRAAFFALPQSGWGFAHAWRRAAVADLLTQGGDVVERWDKKLADFDMRIAAYDALAPATPDRDRLTALRQAEADISTRPDPATTPAALRTALDGKRLAFVAKRGEFTTALATSSQKFLDYYTAFAALPPISDYDAQGFDVTPFGDRAVTASEDVKRILDGHLDAIDKRLKAAKAQLDAHDAASDASAKTAALVAATKALFGDNFQIVPEFALSPTQASEWANAINGSNSGALLSYLKTTAGVEEPVDEWLYGVARVRPAMRAFEAIIMLSGALGGREPVLLPIQFPFAVNASWLALQFPSDPPLDSDRLLYTAHYAAPFDGTRRQCGMLFDEWTEVIPDKTYTTGLTFNYDRPDNEPPQSILIVTPASGTGVWQWADLVSALNDTLDLAKKRSVEPTQLDFTPYTALLPATVMATTLYGISISTSLAVANGAFRNLEALRNG